MLQIDDLSVYFEGVRALDGLALAVPSGSRLAIMGPNGSGKSTLFNALSGLVPLASGRIALGGQLLARRAPHEIAAAGVARTFQTVRIFERLSVLDNVLPVAGRAAATAREAHAHALDVLDAVGLGAVRDQLAGDLGFYAQRRLELARAMAHQPRLLLADEPTGGLAAAEASEIIRLMSQGFGSGTTILLIEHNMAAAQNLCPQAVLMVEGRVVATGPTQDVIRDPQLASVYFGQRLTR